MGTAALAAPRRLLGAAVALAVLLPTVAAADAAEARKPAGAHWRAGSYVCHAHSKKVWHKGHGLKRVVCVKRPKAKRPAGTSSGAWVLPRYVVMCESGGNPRIVNRTGAGAANGYPAGLYQITGPTWRGYGGGKFAPTADQASVYQQGVIAKRVLAGQGPRAWACW